MNRLRQLIHEIHRRSLWQVLGIYVVGAWIAYSVVQSLTEGLDLPAWFPAFALVLFIIGLPIVLATAFVQERAGPAEPEPLPGDRDSDEGASVSVRPAMRRGLFNWHHAILGFLAAFAIWGAIATGWLLLGGERGQSGEADTAPVAAARDEPGDEIDSAAATATLSIESDPPGATVTLTAVQPVGTFSERQPVTIGPTPVADHRLAPAEYLVRLDLERTTSVEFLVSIDADERVGLARSLVSTGPLTEGMVLIAEGNHPHKPNDPPVPAFLIDRFEVTNEQFLEFVSAGGYQDPTFWSENLVLDGNPTPWEAAVATLVDRTGAPGPRGWSGGLYPEGKSDHPVVGVTWYEADAYARWAGKQLPTWDQWWRAALGDEPRVYPWGSDVEAADLRANFGLVDTEPAGSYSLGVSPWGAYDMAGNAGEWLQDLGGHPQKARVVGGSWNAPPYTFDPVQAGSFDPGFADPAIGFRCVKPVPGSR